MGSSFNTTLGEQEYDYGLLFPPGTYTEFDFGDEITISGLSGVNGAQISGEFIPDGFAGVETTADSASMFLIDLQTLGTTVTGNYTPPGAIDGTWAIYSSVTTTAEANWSIEDFDGLITGTVLGPVAPDSDGGNPGGPGNAVPEPGALDLLLVGALVVGLPLGRRRNRLSLIRIA
ncbi:MAG TPA: PEP-CTERM sorting domain-containing protein [Candidatus Limnocylindrales bacterium]|nr:PEP-CTERM sorting domain-containing protein [Candidatus Limnocylindrales bacterium]